MHPSYLFFQGQKCRWHRPTFFQKLSKKTLPRFFFYTGVRSTQLQICLWTLFPSIYSITIRKAWANRTQPLKENLRILCRCSRPTFFGEQTFSSYFFFAGSGSTYPQIFLQKLPPLRSFKRYSFYFQRPRRNISHPDGSCCKRNQKML